MDALCTLRLEARKEVVTLQLFLVQTSYTTYKNTSIITSQGNCMPLSHLLTHQRIEGSSLFSDSDVMFHFHKINNSQTTC